MANDAMWQQRPDSTSAQAMARCLKPLPKLTLDWYQWGRLTFSGGKYHCKCSRSLSFIWVSKLSIYENNHISQGTMNNNDEQYVQIGCGLFFCCVSCILMKQPVWSAPTGCIANNLIWHTCTEEPTITQSSTLYPTVLSIIVRCLRNSS